MFIEISNLIVCDGTRRSIAQCHLHLVDFGRLYIFLIQFRRYLLLRNLETQLAFLEFSSYYLAFADFAVLAVLKAGTIALYWSANCV